MSNHTNLSFIKALIAEKTFSSAKKDNWGDSNVYFVTPEYYNDNRKVLDDWRKKGNNYLSISEYAKEVIWLFDVISPYIYIEFTQKYDVYKSVAEYIENVGSISPEDLLNNILNKLSEYATYLKYSQLCFYDWYRYGTEINDPFFVKFMAMWMIFNFLYNDHYKRNYGNGYKKDGIKIDAYCRDKKEILTRVYDKVFKSSFIEIFKDNAVNSLGNSNDGISNWKILKNKNAAPAERMKALLKIIYIVRCNLFHGWKNPTNERDVELIRCSGEILQMIIEPIWQENN